MKKLNAVVQHAPTMEFNKQFSIAQEFMDLLEAITSSNNEMELRDSLKGFNLNHFKYGFGDSHLWIHQILNGKVSDTRLILVIF